MKDFNVLFSRSSEMPPVIFITPLSTAVSNGLNRLDR